MPLSLVPWCLMGLWGLLFLCDHVVIWGTGRDPFLRVEFLGLLPAAIVVIVVSTL